RLDGEVRATASRPPPPVPAGSQSVVLPAPARHETVTTSEPGLRRVFELGADDLPSHSRPADPNATRGHTRNPLARLVTRRPARRKAHGRPDSEGEIRLSPA